MGNMTAVVTTGLPPAPSDDGNSVAIRVTTTLSASAERTFAAFTDATERERWLTGVPVTIRTAIAPMHLRADWADGIGRILVDVTTTHTGSQLTVHHERLPTPDAAVVLRRFWRGRLAVLKRLLEH